MTPTGVSSDSAVWFVEINGQPNGPLSLEQITDGFHAGRFQARQKVSSEQLHGKWMTVEEAADLYQRRTGTGTIHLPPRPSELVQGNGEPSLPPPVPPGGADPAHSLFEVLQSVRERKPGPTPPKAQVVSDVAAAYGSSRSKVPGQVWLILSITLVLGVSGWVIASLLKRSGDAVAKAPQAETVRAAAPAGAKPPASAPASAAAPAPVAVVPAAKPAAKPFAPALRVAPPAPKFTYAPPPAAASRDRDDRDDRDRERDREREREERERDRDRYRDDRDRDDRDPRDWRAKDGNEPIQNDGFGAVPGTDPGAPHLRPAPPAAAPPFRPGNPHSPSDDRGRDYHDHESSSAGSR